MEFTLSGGKFDLTCHDILEKLQGIEPEIIRLHAVKVNGKLYPVKQALSVVTGLSRADFNSHEARRILKRIGLEVITI